MTSHVLSYAVIHKIYTDEKNGIKVCLQDIFLKPADGVVLSFFIDCIEQGTLEFYKWVCHNFAKYIPTVYYMEVYKRCLVQHIIFTEENVPILRTTDYVSSARSLYQQHDKLHDMSHYALLRASTPIADIVAHVEWMINVGRIHIIHYDTLLEFIVPLLDCPVLLRYLLYTAVSKSREIVEKYSKDLLTICVQQAKTIGYDRILRLVDLMGEVGLLSTAVAQSFVLCADEIPDNSQSANIMSRISFLTRNITLSPLHLLINIMNDNYKIFLRPEKDSKLAIDGIHISAEDASQFGVVLLSILLMCDQRCLVDDLRTNRKSRVANQIRASEMIFEGKLMKSIFSADTHPSIIREVTRMILCRGDITLIRDCHLRMYDKTTSIPVRQGYIKSANLVLQDMILCDDKMSDQALNRSVHILRLFGQDINVSLYHLLVNSSSDCEQRIYDRLIDEICVFLERYKEESQFRTRLLNLADDLVSRIITARRNSRIEEILNTHEEIVGIECIKTLLITPHMDRCKWNANAGMRRLKIRLYNRVKDCFTVWVRLFVTRYLESHPSELLQGILLELTGDIFIHKSYLILGSRIYYKVTDSVDPDIHSICVATKTPVLLTYSTCHVCHEVLSTDIYRDTQEDHGIYYCDVCVAARHDPNVGRASCYICLSDEKELDMKVLGCGHSYCSACIIQLYRQVSAPCCPLCRQSIYVDVHHEGVTEESVCTAFLTEQLDSPEECTKAARRLITEVDNGEYLPHISNNGYEPDD